MPNTATVYLPLSTFVSVACYQRVLPAAGTIMPETGNPTVLTGSGEQMRRSRAEPFR
jgi:hypothetical protein